jgi:hypothetical protein
MKHAIRKLLTRADFFLALLVLPAAALLKFVRRVGVAHLPWSKRALLSVGVFPIANHFFEPLFDARHLTDFDRPRALPGIDWNLDGQIALLSKLTFSAELRDVPMSRPHGPPQFFFNNDTYLSGDAEYWYSIIRFFKPKRIIEIGSGHSSLMARRAIQKNRACDPQYNCDHICIEPYPQPWLQQSGVQLVRKKVEEVDTALFKTLERDDILFIDSTHVIRPQGDVLFEYLQLLPQLKKGAIVHIHDIFSPRDYPREWIAESVRLWNEQYLVEAFLTSNSQWEIIGALNLLKHDHYAELSASCPFLSPEREPGALYIRKVR